LNYATIHIGDEETSFILNPKKFRTGSRGYHGQGKAEFGGKRYQVNILVVEIGSKHKP